MEWIGASTDAVGRVLMHVAHRPVAYCTLRLCCGPAVDMNVTGLHRAHTGFGLPVCTQHEMHCGHAASVQSRSTAPPGARCRRRLRV